MIDFYVRPHVQPLFNVCARYCIKYGFTANLLTLMAFTIGIATPIALISGFTFLSLIFLWCSGLLDILDGTVARLTKTMHPFGAYIDLISDRMVEAALVIGFAFLYPHYYYAYILFLTAVLLHFSAFLAAGALFKNSSEKSMHYDRTIVERAEAFLVFSCMILAPTYQQLLLLSFTFVVFMSGINRIHRVWIYSKSLNYNN